jgi:hypothetical protein
LHNPKKKHGVEGLAGSDDVICFCLEQEKEQFVHCLGVYVIDEEAAEEIARGGNCFAKQWELVEWELVE